MRSRTSQRITSGDVHQWALSWLSALELPDHGWCCTAAVVWGVVLRAAARTCSLCAACRDLVRGPSPNAVMQALSDGLPRTLKVLERRLDRVLTADLPRRMRSRCWAVAIDWHLVPYYGFPLLSRNEIYYGKPRQGTKKFHAYATVCIVTHGVRYTLATTWVRRHEKTVVVLHRLLERIRSKGLKIRRVLLDRAFFNVPVVRFLQAEQLPFLMPVMFRGRRPKKGRPLTGLQWIKRQRAGWYSHTLKNGKQTAKLSVCVSYRTHKNRKDGKRKQQKLLFAAWRVGGTPVEIREKYRLRFGIETSYRQWRQARIYTCTKNPHLRLVFIVIGLMLRNIWVWIHEVQLAEGWAEHATLFLEKLRFRRMLDWIAFQVCSELHDQSPPYVELNA